METNNKDEHQEEIPEVVINEADDKPAGRGIMWTIVIAIVLLAIVYFIFFRNEPNV